jgi:hypothetical protein
MNRIVKKELAKRGLRSRKRGMEFITTEQLKKELAFLVWFLLSNIIRLTVKERGV